MVELSVSYIISLCFGICKLPFIRQSLDNLLFACPENKVDGETFLKLSRDDLPDLLSQFKDRKELWDCLRQVVR